MYQEKNTLNHYYHRILFGSVVVVAVAFQCVFHAEMHKNDVFFIFLKLFFRSTHQNDQKT
jgi:hypothetical protein